MTAARASEEAGRQQLAHIMDEHLTQTQTQTQTIEALHRQVETSNNAARDVQALLRANQDQQQQQQHLRVPPPSTFPTTTGGIISKLPLYNPLQLHRQDCAQESYAVRDITIWAHRICRADKVKTLIRTMYGREDVDPPRSDPPTSGSSLQGTSSQFSQQAAWQSRPGQSVPA